MDHLGRNSFGHDGAILKHGERKACAQPKKDLSRISLLACWPQHMALGAGYKQECENSWPWAFLNFLCAFLQVSFSECFETGAGLGRGKNRHYYYSGARLQQDGRS